MGPFKVLYYLRYHNSNTYIPKLNAKLNYKVLYYLRYHNSLLTYCNSLLAHSLTGKMTTLLTYYNTLLRSYSLTARPVTAALAKCGDKDQILLAPGHYKVLTAILYLLYLLYLLCLLAYYASITYERFLRPVTTRSPSTSSTHMHT